MSSARAAAAAAAAAAVLAVECRLPFRGLLLKARMKQGEENPPPETTTLDDIKMMKLFPI